MFMRMVKRALASVVNIESESLLGSQPKDIYAEWRKSFGAKLTCAVAIKNGPNYKGTLVQRVTGWLGQ